MKSILSIFGVIASLSGFFYYCSHNIEDLTRPKNVTININEIEVFKDTSKFNILIIQYVNGSSRGLEYNAIKNQIKEKITEEIGENNVEIKIFPESEDEILREPISDSEINRLEKRINASLILQIGVNTYPDQNKTFTKMKWILPNKEQNILVTNTKNRTIYALNDIIKGEITYTSEYSKYVTFFSIGLLKFEKKQYSDALEYFEKAKVIIDEVNHNDDSEKLKEIILFKMGLSHYFIAAQNNNILEFEKSMYDFEAALKINPSNIESYNNSGLISELYLDDLETAEKNYKKVLVLNPCMLSTLNNYALLLEKQCKGCKDPCKGCDSAIVYYHKAIKEAEKNRITFTPVYYNLGSLYEKRNITKNNDIDSAMFYYKLAMSNANPDSIVYYLAKNKINSIQRTFEQLPEQRKDVDSVENLHKVIVDSLQILDKNLGDSARTNSLEYDLKGNNEDPQAKVEQIHNEVENSNKNEHSVRSRIDSISLAFEADMPTQIKDIDGNGYNVIKIGEQYWLKENLRVNHYQNGDKIKTIFDNYQWNSIDSGASCYFYNPKFPTELFGRLYNCYVIQDRRKICPLGWHIPNYHEWDILIAYLGGPELSVNKLKSTFAWQENRNDTNFSVFYAIPAGFRLYSGSYSGNVASFWGLLNVDENKALPGTLAEDLYDGFFIFSISGTKNSLSIYPKDSEHLRSGASIRCIRDY